MKKSLTLLSILTVLAGCKHNYDRADAYGNFEVIEVLVSAENQGRLLKLELNEGDRLMKGEVTGLIDTVQLSLKIEQLQAGLRSIYANLQTIDAQVASGRVRRANLVREQERIEKLFVDGAATSKQLDDISGQVRVVDAEIVALESQKELVRSEEASIRVQIDQVREQIRRSTIINPLEGVVLQKYREEGELVIPGQSLYKIASLDDMILRAYITGDQLAEVKTGDQVRVMYDSPGGIKELNGRVTWISPESEFTPKVIQTREERVNLVYAIKIRITNDGSIKIGMPGEVEFIR